jgi:hypothetical protein
MKISLLGIFFTSAFLKNPLLLEKETKKPTALSD